MRGLAGLKSGALLSQAVEALTTAFAARGIDSAQADARILVAHALRLDRAALIAQSERLLEPAEIASISARAVRRLAFEPVARITGGKEFWSLPLRVEPSVLVPRPDTETVVEAALDWVVQRGLRMEKLRILDIGTGSGALLLALLSELRNAAGTGTDISADAIEVARGNAERLGFRDRTSFVVCDIAQGIDGPFDLIVSNPPYIRSEEIASLAPDVRDFDPHIALDGGADGLSAYRKIAGEAHRLLAAGGRLIVELGYGQEHDVSALFIAAGLTVSGPARKDLGGISRALCASAP